MENLYLWMIETWIIVNIKDFIKFIKYNPEEFIADIIMYCIALYVLIIIAKFFLKKFLSSHIKIRRRMRKITDFLKIPLHSVDYPIKILLNLVQTISIIIAIIFSDNLLNIINLEKANRELNEAQTNLKEVQSTLKRSQSELKNKENILKETSNKNSQLKIKTKELTKEIRDKEDELHSILWQSCFFNIKAEIYQYFNNPFNKLNRIAFQKGKSIPIDDAVKILNESFSIKKEKMLLSIISSLSAHTLDTKQKKMFSDIERYILNDENLQSPVADVNAYIKERDDMFDKETFFLFTIDNISKYNKIDTELSQKYIFQHRDYLIDYITKLENSMKINMILNSH